MGFRVQVLKSRAEDKGFRFRLQDEVQISEVRARGLAVWEEVFSFRVKVEGLCFRL